MVLLRHPGRRRAVIAVLLVVLAAGWLIGLSRHSPSAGDLILSRGYLVDETRSLSFQDVRKLAFLAFDGTLARGNQHEHLWLSLVLPATSGDGKVLIFEPASLRDVVVYQKPPDRPWQASRGGMRMPFETRLLPWLNYSIPVITDPKQESVIYVRVDTPTAFLSVRVIPSADAQYEDGLRNFMAGLSMGVVLLLMLSALALWLATRDDIWLYQLILNLSALVLFYFLLGLAAKYLLPASEGIVDRAVVFFSCFLQFCVSLTFPRVLRIVMVPSWTFSAYRAGVFLFPVLCLMMWLDRDDIALRGNHVLMLLQAIWAVSILALARHADTWLLTIFRVMFAVFIIHSLLWIWPLVMGGDGLGILQNYPAVSGNLFLLAMLTVMLLRKTRLDVRDHQEQRLRSRLAEQHLLQETRRHEETSAFLGMMMHELKNPLNSIRIMAHNMSAESVECRDSRRLAHICTAVDDMDRVLNLSADVDVAEQGALRIQTEAFDLLELVQKEACARSPRIGLECPFGELVVKADRTVLGLMLANLVDNALKYSPPDTPIRIFLQANETAGILSIENLIGKSGCPDPARVFDKYYRTPGAAKMSGMGLGLYWIRLVSRMMNISIACEMVRERIIFRLTLPR